MTGLVFYPVAATDPEGAQVVADGWFTPVNLGSVRAIVRIGGEGTVPTERLTAAIESGMLHGFRELSAWRSDRAAAGLSKLEDTTALTINQRNLAVVLWERVVTYFAAAELQGQYRDISATDDGLDRAAEKVATSDDSRRIALAAVADLRSLGASAPVSPNRVELI